MRTIKFGRIALLLLFLNPSAWAGQKFNPFTGKPDYCATVTDNTTSSTGCQTLVVGGLTDNGDGTFTLTAAGSTNSFQTLSVPAGTNPVADSATDTLTITESAGLDITGTAATDTLALALDLTELSTFQFADGNELNSLARVLTIAHSGTASSETLIVDTINRKVYIPGLPSCTNGFNTDASGMVLCAATAGTGDITDVGPDCASGACFTDGNNDTLVFEGATDNTVESTFLSADPTVGDQSYSLPNAAQSFTGFLAADDSEVTNIDGDGLAVTTRVLAVSVGNALQISSDAVAVTLDAINSAEIDETDTYTWSGTNTFSSTLTLSGTTSLSGTIPLLTFTDTTASHADGELYLDNGSFFFSNASTGVTPLIVDTVDGTVDIASLTAAACDVKSSNGTLYCGTDATGAGGGDAITVATVAATDPDFVEGTAIDITLDTGASPDTITIAADLTELSSATLGAGSFTTLTFDAGASDPQLTASSGDLELTTGSFTIGNAGVRMTSDGSGGLTFLGRGAGNDEDLKIELDAVANNATWSSSTGVTTMVLSSLDLTVGGGDINVSGSLPTITFDDTDGGHVNPHVYAEGGTLFVASQSTGVVAAAFDVVDGTVDVPSLDAAACDVKASNGTLYCGSDATGAGVGDPVLIDGTGVSDGSGVDLQGGTGVDITFNAGASPDTASFAVDGTELTSLSLGNNNFTGLTLDASGTNDLHIYSAGGVGVFANASTGTAPITMDLTNNSVEITSLTSDPCVVLSSNGKLRCGQPSYEYSITSLASGMTWTNQPAAETELVGSTRGRIRADLSTMSYISFHVTTAGGGASGAEIWPEYSLDESTWTVFAPPTTLEINISAAGTFASDWVQIPPAARTSVYVRVMGRDGNAAGDPIFGEISIRVR